MIFAIELIRKIFAYEHIYRKFEMKDFKYLIKLDDKYINQKHFKEWIDKNNLLDELMTWLIEQKLEKTFPEVYVEDKTDAEIFVEGFCLAQTDKKKKDLLDEYLKKAQEKNENMLD